MFRYVDDIGMFAFDRSIPETCTNATTFCRANCYNDKLYRIYPAMHGKDIKNEAEWEASSVEMLTNELDRKKKPTNRVRACTRGESLGTYSDILKMRDLALSDSKRNWWIPTRAWRNPLLMVFIQTNLRLPNVRLLASMDPSNSAEEWEMLKANGWSTMYFGDDTATTTPNGDRSFKCPKTWKHMNGHCSICKGGCFKSSRIDVHLKAH